jgi:serine protease inhibitor
VPWPAREQEERCSGNAASDAFPENDSLREQSFAEGYDIFNARDAGHVLSTANALWIEKDYPLLGNFTSDIEVLLWNSEDCGLQ